MEAADSGHTGIRASLPKKVAVPVAQLESVYTTTHCTGNQQEELKAQFLVPQESHDVAATTETWWDDSHA